MALRLNVLHYFAETARAVFHLGRVQQHSSVGEVRYCFLNETPATKGLNMSKLKAKSDEVKATFLITTGFLVSV